MQNHGKSLDRERDPLPFLINLITNLVILDLGKWRKVLGMCMRTGLHCVTCSKMFSPYEVVYPGAAFSWLWKMQWNSEKTLTR